MYTHTQIPELKFFVIQLGANAPSEGHLEPILGALRAKIFQLFYHGKKNKLNCCGRECVSCCHTSI